jgi:hypothetical protein
LRACPEALPSSLPSTHEGFTMSLYTQKDTPLTALSAESFMLYHGASSRITLESANTFLGQSRDVFVSFTGAFSTEENQRMVTDATKDKFEVLARAKEVRFVDFRHTFISKPEGFKGLYMDYLDDLFTSSVTVCGLIAQSTDRLRMQLSTFINEYKDDEVGTIYGYLYFKKDIIELNKIKARMKAYFGAGSNKSKTTPDEVLRSLEDLPKLYTKLELMSTVLSHSSLKKTERDVKGLSEMVDMLIEHNVNSRVLNNNNEAKQQLMECIHITAQIVEYYNALYAQMLVFCATFRSLTGALKDHP